MFAQRETTKATPETIELHDDWHLTQRKDTTKGKFK